MRTAGLVAGLAIGLSAAPALAAPCQNAPLHGAGALADVDRQLGPFAIGGHRFTVRLHLKRERPKDRTDDETVTRMEIRDETGRVHYSTNLACEVEGGRLSDTVAISAERLQGNGGVGLLITSDVLPSPPLGGGSYQVFGLFDGKLIPFGKQISLDGGLADEASAPTQRKTFAEPGLAKEVLRFRVWTGNVFAVIPVSVDWIAGRVGPAWRCYRMTARGLQPQCRFPVVSERAPQTDELTFVRLHAEPEEGFGTPQHVVVKKGSHIEVLEGAGEQIWDEGAEAVSLSVGGDVWLRVRIDGREGWIHTQEDFDAIGLPQSG